MGGYGGETNREVKVLKIDNGLEFCNDKFNKFCEDYGIVRHRTVKYTPQKNRVAKRTNKTLLDKIRCLMIGSGVPKGFWVEAIATVIYLVNRSPNCDIGFKVPEEVWSGKPPSLDNLRNFYCATYVHQSEGKLDPRADKCVFLGYRDRVK